MIYEKEPPSDGSYESVLPSDDDLLVVEPDTITAIFLRSFHRHQI